VSVKVIVESKLKEDTMSGLLPFLKRNLPNVRSFKGCLSVSVFLDKDDGKMIFDEEWLSVEDHRQYIASIADSGVMGELVGFLESQPEINYFDRLEM
jgi:quinol monooxygenase YgiN